MEEESKNWGGGAAPEKVPGPKAGARVWAQMVRACGH